MSGFSLDTELFPKALPGTLSGFPVHVSEWAATKERNYPESRHRSARVRKKLNKRFGGEFRMVPAVFFLSRSQSYHMHPECYAVLKNMGD